MFRQDISYSGKGLWWRSIEVSQARQLTGNEIISSNALRVERPITKCYAIRKYIRVLVRTKRGVGTKIETVLHNFKLPHIFIHTVHFVLLYAIAELDQACLESFVLVNHFIGHLRHCLRNSLKNFPYDCELTVFVT